MPDIDTNMGVRDWARLLTLSVLWGGSFFFVGVAVHAIPPLTLVSLRVGLAALALWALVPLLGHAMPRGWRVWLAFLGMGLLNNVVPFALIVWGQTQIASGLASILNAATPLFTVLVAGALLPDERATPLKLAGVVIGLTGVIVMIGPEALEGLGGAVLAQLAVVGATVSYAFAGVYGRRFRVMGIDPIVTAAGQMAASALFLAPIALIVEQPFSLPMPGPWVWASVAGLALLSTALAYILYFQILSSAGATNLLLVTFLVPVSAIWLGVTILGESLEMLHLAGMAVIGLGLAAIDGRLFKRRGSC